MSISSKAELVGAIETVQGEMSSPDRIMKSSQVSNHQQGAAPESSKPSNTSSQADASMTQKSSELTSSSASSRKQVDCSTETTKQQTKTTPVGRRRHLLELGSAKAMLEISSQQRRRLKVPHPAKLSAQQRRPRRRGLKGNFNAGGNNLHLRTSGLISSSTPPPPPPPLTMTMTTNTNASPGENSIQTQGGRQDSGQLHVCAGCTKPIRDRYLFQACDKFWHNKCLKCDRCQAKLGELGPSLYAANNMNLCRQDYNEMFGQKAICAVCDKLIYASEMVMRARQNVYHLECFACQLCGLRFCVGDRFHLCENKIVCQFDYDEHIYPIQQRQQQQQQQHHHHHHHHHQIQYAQLDPHEAGNQRLDSWDFQQIAAPRPSSDSALAEGARFRSERNDFDEQPVAAEALVYHTMESSVVSSESAANPEMNQHVLGCVTPTSEPVPNESADPAAGMSEEIASNSVAIAEEPIAETGNG